MGIKKISQEFRLKNIEEINKCFIKEINQNEIISKMHKNRLNALLFLFLRYWMCFKFLLLVLYLVFYMNHPFCNIIKNVCNNCRH